LVNRDEAGALLRDVAGTEKRVREFLVYTQSGDHLILWGIIWVLGFGGTHVLTALHQDRWTGWLWLALDLFGGIGSVTIGARSARQRGDRAGVFLRLRPLFAVIAVVAFGVLWTVLGHLGWHEQIAFYPTLLGVVGFVVGLWAGRALALGGAIMVALTLVGYFCAGSWFDVWMAAVGGSALIAGGLWLRS
jgi:hypothetical protein